MSLHHAVAFVDHESAEILQFALVPGLAPGLDESPPQGLEHKVQQQQKFTRQHHSGVRTEHEFFGAVCDAFDGIAAVLVVGGHTGLADFRHYVDKHRPLVAPRIAGYEVVDHPSERQLVALARAFFVKHEQMAGTRAPS